MKKNAFTLVELLGVIALLAVIAMLVTPLVVKTINDSRREAFLDNAKMLRKAAENYYMENEMSGNMLPLLVTYNNKNVSYCQNKPSLSYSGQNPYSGNIYINTSGEIEMKIYDKATNRCAVKTKTEKSPHLEEISKEQCQLSYSCN